MLKKLALIIGLSLASGLAPPVFAAPVLEVAPQFHSASIAPWTDYLEDPERSLTIDDVVSPRLDGMFNPVGGAFYSHFISRSAFWYRVEVKNATEVSRHLILQNETAWIDRIEIYEKDAEGGYSLNSATGDMVPLSSWDMAHHTPLYNLTIEAGGSRRLYIRVVTVDAFLAPLTLWSEDAFRDSNQSRLLYFGSILGIILVMLLYNMILMLFLREKSYFYYNIYLFSLAIWFFTYTGFSYLYIWPEFPWFQNRMMVSLDFMMQLCAVLFAKNFLNTAGRLAWLDRLLNWAIRFYIVMIALDMLTSLHYFTGFVCLIALQVYGPLLAFSGIMSLYYGITSARFYLLAWISTSIGVSITALIVAGLIPYNFWLFRAGEIGVMIDVVLLALALADRINIMRGEKEDAEKISRNVLERSREDLAILVDERTAELKQARDTAEEATKLKDKFVNMVSHDLKAPLASMSGLLSFADLEDAAKSMPARNLEFIRRARASLDGLLRMTDQLMSISRLKTGKLIPFKKVFTVKEPVDEVVLTLEQLASKKGVRLVNELPEGMEAQADLALFKEVVYNLVSNSIKFCRDGDSVVFYHPEEAPNVIAVRDTGPGVKENARDKIFSYAERSASLGTMGEKGFGLGLPFCREIMVAHGGDLTLKSGSGQGAEFWIELPEKKPVALIMDDQPVDRLYFKTLMLENLSIEILESEDGIEALEVLKMAAPNILIADVYLKGMGGLELLELIMNSPKGSSLPVIIVSGGSGSKERDDELRLRAMDLGAVDFFIKPVSAEDFLRSLRKNVNWPGGLVCP